MKRFIISFVLFFAFIAGKSEIPADFLYIHPAPESHYVSSHAAIVVRLNHPTAQLTNPETLITATNKYGRITGKTTLASDDQTLIFQPHEPFAPGETISVSLAPRSDYDRIASFEYQFHVADFETTEFILSEHAEASRPLAKATKVAGHAQIMPNGVSVPSDFPHVKVTTNMGAADGYIYLHNISDHRPYNIIFDNDGSPVWYERWSNGDVRRDFKMQKNGVITMHTRHGGNRYVGYNANFKLVDEYEPAGGFYNDGHELQVLDNGNYLIIGRRIVKVDMSQIIKGGDPEAQVQETTMQEFTPNHDMIFNWPALEHLSDGLPYLELDNPTAKKFRFPHMNAIDVDVDDGHLLVSNRMLSEITKVNRQTGAIIWRLGGAHSDFTFVNDPFNGFSCQHDVRSLGNNRYSVFDNGNYHSPRQSRGVVYELDPEAKTATLVWAYPSSTRELFSYYMGSMQPLPNGNLLINWAVGELPKATEVTPEGEVVYEMNFLQDFDTYRTFRQPWNGVVARPRLFVEQEPGSVALIFNKFGDSNVAYYNIYGGTSPRPTSVLDTSRTTLKKLITLTDNKRYYFRVTAVDADGNESAYSDEKNILVNYITPGENMIDNGDFSDGLLWWNFDTDGARASTSVTSDGLLQIKIKDGGDDFENVQLRQDPLPLVQGRTYRLTFDAYSVENRIIEVQIEQATSPWTNYSKINPTPLRRSQHHYTYDFVMQEASDYNAHLVFNCGAQSGDVFVDNVSLSIVDEEMPLVELPESWQHTDIGAPNLDGNAGLQNGHYVVQASGSDISGSSDHFHFAYQKITGDVEISAQVLSIGMTHGWAKAGLMIRNTLAAGSAHAMMANTVSNGAIFQARHAANASATSSNGTELDNPAWVKIKRQGNVLYGFESLDGAEWSIVGSEEIDMNKTVYCGFAVTSHNNDALCTAYFDDLQIVADTVVAELPSQSAPISYKLYPAFPNPFNSATTITYTLPEKSKATIKVYNTRGKLVQDLLSKIQYSGEYQVIFDASNLASGLYICKLDATAISDGAKFRDMIKMTVIK